MNPTNHLTLAVIFADYDPGTLSAFYIMFLTAALALLLLAVSGVLFCLKARRLAGWSLLSAGICFLIGIGIARVVIWLSQKGIIHFL